MRKVAACIVGVLGFGAMSATAVGGTSATAPNGQFISLDVDVFPPVASTSAKPRGAVIDFHSFTGNRIKDSDNARAPSTLLRLPRGLRTNMSLFPACTVSTTTAYSRCSSSSLIGRGTAEGAIRSASDPPTFAAVALKGFNGTAIGGRRTLIFQGTLNNALVAELVFTLNPSSSGIVLDDFVPPGSTPGPIGITKFDFKTIDRTVTRQVRGRPVKVHFLTTPTSCPAKGWAFAQTNTFQDGTRLTATDVSPCTT